MSEVANPIGGVGGGPGAILQGDTKDVTASHMGNNSHNEMNLQFGSGQHVQP